MIHLQVCLSASQASSHSFSPPLPRWAKAPHLLRLQRHCRFSHMTAPPRGVCLSLWIPTKQALMASLCITWVNHIPLRKICRLCSTSHDIKRERTQTWHHSSSHKRIVPLHNFAELCGVKCIKSHVRHQFLKTSQCEPSTQKGKKKICTLFLIH